MFARLNAWTDQLALASGPWCWRYGLAVLAVGAGLALRTLLHPVLDEDGPLLPFVFSVLLIAWFGGFGPGLAAGLLSMGAALQLFLPPDGAWFPLESSEFTHLCLFAAQALLISGLCESRCRSKQARQSALEAEKIARAQAEARATELAKSNADLERFAFAASHDLREPLRTVLSYSQLLSRRYTGRLDADADEFMGFIEDGAKRMGLLIDDLLDYSRVVHLAEQPALVDSAVALQAAWENCQAAVEESGATITFDSLPTLGVNELQLTQVLQNLISNALKYRAAEPPRIHVSATRSDGYCIFSVRDNGIGIPAQYHDQIFVLFKRLQREKASGTGVGLALCKRIVERHGGRIWVESEPGKGSTFYFSIRDADKE